MTLPPDRPKIYHITHVANLPGILEAGGLLPDQTMHKRTHGVTTVGISEIKARRLTLPVKCHEGDSVGDYVPFYFCPRSVMLYLLHMGNHPALSYRGGQAPIVHLEADLIDSVAWANQNSRRWAFTLSNAAANYTEFRADLDALKEINWEAVAARAWSDQDVKDDKQAEFLVHSDFPFELISHIGVHSARVQKEVQALLAASRYRPEVTVEAGWYY